ncbi:hypothetical protein EXIGLDRAFT_33245 [Exidia glandulosa HHB12029]|uniref:Uncharacterized protein n=1 Tax=Exidia glandulosa HHB12029 TaxID=1314781 RepID=A0A165ISV4_EXIGL|nr:hypothetical protein EXIGLDRAFT_33245 [Exidia glandulosa HHB12029]
MLASFIIKFLGAGRLQIRQDPLLPKHQRKAWTNALVTNISLIGTCLALGGSRADVKGLVTFAQISATFGIASAAYFLRELETLSSEEYHERAERYPISHWIQGSLPTWCCELACASILIAAGLNRAIVLIVTAVLIIILLIWTNWGKMVTFETRTGAWLGVRAEILHQMVVHACGVDVVEVA